MSGVYGRVYPLKILRDMNRVVEVQDPPKSPNQTRREQLALLPANRKKMRY